MTEISKKIAIIGTGNWGKNLVRTFSELGALYAISDKDEDKLRKLKEQHNISEIKTDYKDILNDENINCVAIASPAITHYQIVKEALLAGKDVFVEKPLALDTKEAEELIEIAEDNHKILMIDHLLQYHPAVVKLKELIDEGSIGKLQYIYSNRLNIGKLRNEENILWSFAPHDISVILELVGTYPLEIEAFGEAYLQDKIYDTTITELTFTDKLKAHIFVSWLHPFKEQKLVVIGSKCMAVFNDVEKEEKLVLFPHRIEWIKQMPVAEKAEKEVIGIEKREPLKEACLHFIDCVINRTKPKTDAKEALSVLKVLDAAQKSLDKKKQ